MSLPCSTTSCIQRDFDRRHVLEQLALADSVARKLLSFAGNWRSMSLFRFKNRGASWITIADRARGAGQWALAGGHYRKALALNPRNAHIWVHYRQALKLKRETPGALIRRADGLRDGKKYAEAAELYNLVLTREPNRFAIHVQCGHMKKKRDVSMRQSSTILQLCEACDTTLIFISNLVIYTS